MNHDAIIAANRFGLGARPGELNAIQSDPRGWLRAQLQGARPLPDNIQSLPSSAQAFQAQVEAIKMRREAQKQAAQSDTSNSDASNTPTAQELKKPGAGQLRNVIQEYYLAQVAARYQVATHSAESFRERLVHFWSNHFAVSVDKIIVAAVGGTLENEAIRPNLHRSFYDLLLAADSHPAMILYLDNQASTGPNSQLAELINRRGKAPSGQQRKIDINENLGREILELHTLGVKGGYTQADVTSFAKVLTGWSIGGDPNGAAARLGIAARMNQGEPGCFAFRDGLHEPGAQTLLGKRYNQDGIEQPKAVFKDLARHPSTANFIASKLARHFIADDPPAEAVAYIAKVFRDTDGHLPSVHAAVIDSDAAWSENAVKLKTPHEFVVSAFRAFDYLPDKPQQVLAPFELLGQRPYSPGSPAGWADIAGQWDGPDALMKRIEWATQVGQRVGTQRSPLQLADASLGTVGEHTRMALNGAADAAQGIVLWLMSPEFQRR